MLRISTYILLLLFYTQQMHSRTTNVHTHRTQRKSTRRHTFYMWKKQYNNNKKESAVVVAKQPVVVQHLSTMFTESSQSTDHCIQQLWVRLKCAINWESVVFCILDRMDGYWSLLVFWEEEKNHKNLRFFCIL